MPGVDEAGPGGVGRVQEKCGDELLVLEEGGEVAGHVLGDRFEARLDGGGLPERPDDACGLLDRSHSLAAHVTEQETGVGARVVAVVEVSADQRVLARGLVADGDVGAPRMGGQHRQHRSLRHLGERGEPAQLAFPAHPDGGDHDGDRTDQGDVDAAGPGAGAIRSCRSRCRTRPLPRTPPPRSTAVRDAGRVAQAISGASANSGDNVTAAVGGDGVEEHQAQERERGEGRPGRARPDSHLDCLPPAARRSRSRASVTG